MDSSPAPLLYFAYGSNLCTAQMRARCPASEPLALAHLAGWSWIINERGYANIVKNARASSPATPLGSSAPTDAKQSSAEAGKEKEREGDAPPGVYGLLYRLDPSDLPALDACEGVPWAYERRLLDVTVVAAAAESRIKTGVLAYVDGLRVRPARPRPEYVGRMNRGLAEAVSVWGLPREYVEGVVRGFVPEV
ncbi:hypothetical protein F4775DRAFT_548674 [Biscogniauxia sp. FL1348]|nr:hypothetical protein F4775DRAFT_548674 [Biscogniauxia sp. FL1348]